MKTQLKTLASRVSRFVDAFVSNASERTKPSTCDAIGTIASTFALAAALGLALPAQADTVVCTNCLTFSADKPFGLTTWTESSSGKPNPFPKLQYSTDQKTWDTFDGNSSVPASPVGAEYKIYLRGSGNQRLTLGDDKNGIRYFSITNTPDSAATAIACSGNIETLLDYETVAKGEHPTMGEYAYRSLFTYFRSLTTAPTLPATNLTTTCYGYLFCGCWSLKEAPELPAMTLAQNCYERLFIECFALEVAPKLPATNLMGRCYDNMFKSCTSLTAAPELSATTLADSCCANMFQGCTSLTAAPALPAKGLAKGCYSYMFQGCTSLTAAPALPAKELDQQCYSSMFQGCTALKTIPALDVSMVTNWCCESMFADCSSLVVNMEGPGVEWKIPEDVTILVGRASLAWDKDMFLNTAGTITNSTEVTPGQTYYVASAPVALNVTPVEGATFQAYTNGVPADVPCTVDYIMPVTVVYTATPGYAFSDGTTEFTTNITERAETVTVTLPKDQWPKPLPPVKVEVSAPEGATVAVYSNKVDAANSVPVDGTGTVLSNSIAYVVYTVNESGKYFENGQTVVTNTLTTANDPATDTAVPTKIGTPTVMLGIVAQRYPWNGTLDIQYKTPYANGTKTVTFKANGTVLGTAQGTGGQPATVSFDLTAVPGGAFKDKQLKSVKITATIVR